MNDHGPVLVAEDDLNDIFLLRRAFQKAGVPNAVLEAHNGQEAIDYLSGLGPYADRAKNPYPALLFLDLKMPLLDGFDVMSWLQTQPAERRLPVVVLTSSNQEKDIQKAREMGAQEYRVKPQVFEELVEIVKQIRDRWLIRNST
jgi:CheY-like chemotaxis protein